MTERGEHVLDTCDLVYSVCHICYRLYLFSIGVHSWMYALERGTQAEKQIGHGGSLAICQELYSSLGGRVQEALWQRLTNGSLP